MDLVSEQEQDICPADDRQSGGGSWDPTVGESVQLSGSHGCAVSRMPTSPQEARLQRVLEETDKKIM